MQIRALALVSLVGLSTLIGCAGQNDSTTAHSDTGIGSEAGRLIGSEASDKTPYLGGQIGSLIGRQTARGVATQAKQAQ